MDVRDIGGGGADAGVAPVVVAIGASAGGLEALEALLAALPGDASMAYLVLQHLAPDHVSMLPEILARATSLPVEVVEDGVCLFRNRVYVVPSGVRVSVSRDRVVHLTPRPAGAQPHAIDDLMRSLAETLREDGIGVVLSGSGTDGTEGLRAIRTQGGLTLAQRPDTARFPSMPESAIAGGSVDFIRTPGEIGEKLGELAGASAALSAAVTERGPHDLERLLEVLSRQRGVDFRGYKRTSVMRRIARRMSAHHVDTLPAYVEVLESDPEENERLQAEILIHVTRFFRDPEVFELLAKQVVPELLEERAARKRALRIWVAGCATGEEAYSLAILLAEASPEGLAPGTVQIFGTDLSGRAIEVARRGTYPHAIASDVSAERLARFFVAEDDCYRIRKDIREACLFVQHDLTTDPPFSRLDLVSCRNVLIYFEPDLQARVLPLFHYALNPGGVLVLGRSESVSAGAGLFTPLDKVLQIYRREGGAKGDRPALPDVARAPMRAVAEAHLPEPDAAPNIARESERLLLTRYAPAAVVVDASFRILHFLGGRFGRYLDPAPGQAHMGLLGMVAVGLRSDLELALEQARDTGSRVRLDDLRISLDGLDASSPSGFRDLSIEVIPIQQALRSRDPYYLVVLEEPRQRGFAVSAPQSVQGATPQRVADLEQEVVNTRHYIDALTARYTRSSEELASAHEELLSSNEELQSTNEELETAKEELQSTNEELITLNEELQTRNQDLSRINDDLTNLLASVDIAILMLDEQSRIRRFTPEAKAALNLIPSDVGRPLSDLRMNLRAVDVGALVDDMQRTGEPREQEVQKADGTWLRLQVRPYRSSDDEIIGSVLSLVDIDVLKKARAEAENATRAKDLFLATVTHELRGPLVAILGWTKRLLGKAPAPEQVREYGEVIERNARSANELLADLHDLAGVVAGKLRMDLAPIPIAEVVGQALDGQRPPAHAKGVALVLEAQPEIPLVRADARRIQQIVVNLVSNAIRHTPEHGTVTVRVMKGPRRRVWLQVEDTGSGLAPDELQTLFEPNHQSRSGGTGLGLSIVRQLVELHGGRVWADSEPDRGARFTVELPIDQDDGSPDTAPSPG